MARRRDKSGERSLAARRIDALLRAARVELLAGRGDLAHRYGSISLRVAQKYQTGFSPAQKSQLCRKCAVPRSAATSRTRLHDGRLVTTCLSCGAVARRPLHLLPAPLPAMPSASAAGVSRTMSPTPARDPLSRAGPTTARPSSRPKVQP